MKQNKTKLYAKALAQVLEKPARHNAAALGGKKLDTLENKIIDQLKREPMKADQMARLFALPVSQIGTTLSLMQLKGFINLDNGKYYIN